MERLNGCWNSAPARRLIADIGVVATRPWSIMEVCGFQTHIQLRRGLDDLLPEGVRVAHGPGCPICVTPSEMLERALSVAAAPDVIFTIPGDLLLVPGWSRDLADAEARVVAGALDAVRLAREHPERQVVFFAVGFERAAPAMAMAVLRAFELGMDNFSVLVSHVMVPPPMTAVLESADGDAQAFLVSGQTSAVMSWTDYGSLARRYQVPIGVIGLEPVDLLEGVLMVVRQLERGRAEAESQRPASITDDADTSGVAWGAMRRVFRVTDRSWRGLDSRPALGVRLAREFAAFDAAGRFGVPAAVAVDGGR